MTSKLAALSASLVIGLAASSVHAEGDQSTGHVAAPPHPTPGKLDNGKISLTKLVPPLTKVFDYSGNIWDRTTLFGDFNGGRTRLYNKGFTFDAQLTQVYQGVVSGGAEDNGNGKYNGLLEINSTLDTAKLGWWSGGMISLTAMTSYGTPITSEAGNLSPVNMTPMWPIPFDDSTELVEYYVTQAFPNKWTLIAGRLDATNFLDKNSFANNPESQFLNASMNNMLLWGEMLSFSTYAALLMVPIKEGVNMGIAVWDPETQPGQGGVWDNYGAAVTFIIDYHAFGGQKGVFSPVLAYVSKDAGALDNNKYLIEGILDGDPVQKSGNWLFSFVGEQYLWTPEGAHVPSAKGGHKEEYTVPTQDFATNQPGIGLFYRFGYMPKDRNPYNMSLSGGLGARGIIPGRPYDRMGIGAYAMFASNDLKDQVIVGKLLDDEVGFEAFYNYAITPWLQLSLDLQYISSGIEKTDNAFVIGTRLFTRF